MLRVITDQDTGLRRQQAFFDACVSAAIRALVFGDRMIWPKPRDHLQSITANELRDRYISVKMALQLHRNPRLAASRFIHDVVDYAAYMGFDAGILDEDDPRWSLLDDEVEISTYA